MRIPISTPTWLLVLLFATTSLFAASPKQPLALVTDLTGNVTVDRTEDGTTVAARWGLQLYQGDQVKTLDGASVSIMFSNNNVVTLGGNSAMTISGSADDTAGEQEVRSVGTALIADASALSLHRTGMGEVSALGGLRSDGDGAALMAWSPRSTQVATQHPTFTWTAGDDFEVYRVEVSTEAGTHWSGETTQASLAYPEDAPALEPGVTYFWQVSGEAMLDEVKAPAVTFTVATQAALDGIAAGQAQITDMFSDNLASSTYYYVLGNYFIEQGLLASAIDTFSEIADQHPNAALPQEILGRLYTKVGLTNAAVAALQRALDLSH